MKHDYLLLGEVVRPQGIHGEVKLRHYTDDPERFLDLTIVYREREGRYEPIGVLGARVREDDVFLMLEGVADRNAAEALRGKSFGELFGDFFTQMNGRPMTEAEQAALDALMEEVNGG